MNDRLTERIDRLARSVEGAGGTAAHIYMSEFNATRLDNELRPMRRMTSAQPDVYLKDGDTVQGMILHISEYVGEGIYITAEPVE